MQATSEGFTSNQAKAHWPAAVFFGLFLVLGIFIYKDYGMSFDEHWGRENGVINASYMARKLAPALVENKNYCPECKILTEYPDVDHGPVFEIGTTVAEWVLKLKDHQDIFLLRHFCTFLLFYLSTIFFYLLLLRRFGQPLFALAGVLMLAASPRIFADAFYNAKDLPFLSMTIISCYTLQNFLKKKTFGAAAWHALACGLTIDIRILGLLFPAMTIVLSLYDLKLFRKDGWPASRILPVLLVFLVLCGGFIIVFWPYLWEKPFVRFPQILERSSQYPWTGKVLFFGKFYMASSLPWHYLPGWVLISTPLLYTFLFAGGFSFGFVQLLRNGWRLYRGHHEQLDLAMAGLFFTPIAATIILKLVLYDGWRHMYFIYPAFIYLAVFGMVKAFSWFRERFSYRTGNLLRNGLLAVWALGMVQILAWMAINHPHQNVYFSFHKGEKVREQFDLDYWGLSYRQALQFVLQDTDKPVITIHANTLPGRMNSLLFSPETRKRFAFVDESSQADYFLTEYRWHPEDYAHLKGKEVHTIVVDGFKIMSVFRLK